MSENNINGYANEQTTLSDSDWFDIDAYLGVDDYESKKVSFGTIKSQILSQTSNLYNSNGTLTGNRSIDADGNAFSLLNASIFQFNDQSGNSIATNFEIFEVRSGATNAEDRFIKYGTNYSNSWNNTTSPEALVPLRFVTANGTTANRPTQGITGQTYFDTDLGYPIWFNGTNWVNATGQVV
jgi:hypothetical protein